MRYFLRITQGSIQLRQSEAFAQNPQKSQLSNHQNNTIKDFDDRSDSIIQTFHGSSNKIVKMYVYKLLLKKLKKLKKKSVDLCDIEIVEQNIPLLKFNSTDYEYNIINKKVKELESNI